MKLFGEIAWKKSKFFVKLPKNIEIFRKFALKNRSFLKIAWKNWNFSKIYLDKSNVLVKLPEKIKCFGNLPGKTEILFTRIHDPQISNQIDAADIKYKLYCIVS